MSLGRRLALTLDDPQLFITGFDAAIEMVRQLVPEDAIPRLEQFFPNALSEPGENDSVSKLSRKLLRAQQQRIRDNLNQVADGTETFFLMVTSHETCGDFLFAPIVDSFNRMARTFRISVRLYLGLPVTPAICNIGDCQNAPIHPFGAHGHHAPGKLTHRHHGLRDCISSFISFQATAHHAPHEVRKEVYLDEAGYMQRPDAPDKSRARCDFMITKQDSNYRIFADVCVIHPNLEAPGTSTQPLFKAKQAEATKFKRYCKNYDITTSQIKPVVFETFGGWSPRTYDFLIEVTRGIALNDTYLFNKLWRRLRNRIAVTLARGEAEIILRLNAMNAVSFSSPRPQTSRSARSPSLRSDRALFTPSALAVPQPASITLPRVSPSHSSTTGKSPGRFATVLQRLSNRLRPRRQSGGAAMSRTLRNSASS